MKKRNLFTKKFAVKLLIGAILSTLSGLNAFAVNDGPPSFSIKTPKPQAIPISNPFGDSGKASIELPTPNLDQGSSIELQTISDDSNSLEESNSVDFEVVPRVENLELKVKNLDSIEISFDEISGVETYFVLYGTSKVETEDDVYNMPPKDTEGKTSVQISNLEENVDYFFSVVAKANDDYSEFLSDEVSIKIDPSLLTVPEITSAKASNNKFIEINFSSEMDLTNISESNFSLKETFDDSEVTIHKSIVVDSKTLKLRTSSLKSGFEYNLEIKDIKSTDQIELTDNSLTFRTEDLISLEEFEISEVNVLDFKGVEIIFNDEILEKDTIKENLNIVLKADPNKIISIEDVLANPNDPRKFLLVLEGLTEDNYQILIQDIEGVNKGSASDSNKTKEFKGVNPVQNNEIKEDSPVEIVEDKNSPADVRNLNARFIDEALINLEISFDPSVDLDDDLDKYELYFAKDSDNYFAYTQISKDQTDPIFIQDLDLDAEFYNIKVTAKDTNNNESTGAIFKLFLPETGPAGTLALLAMSILGSRRLTRKKD
ncbi:hypothetical protein CL656_05895 [bacterium]|nr:hypothetical protein [bacterium]|tara:strand:- start:1075 stop:2706 length:1632 start_codon:yes stop_codon:yes gene_type:complete